ncbi:hypothetical protein EVAR_30130_1 [Eumeta japonica]|uniref:Cytosolic carboxypeptidase-like protein 5 n=1 Tax=Eumeta variegata TaxID=151549 RepID=A0A4C1WIV1_EUMVA|nr:hypothetical protein EVAR_30130_1 [Eumeta japonica]
MHFVRRVRVPETHSLPLPHSPFVNFSPSDVLFLLKRRAVSPYFVCESKPRSRDEWCPTCRPAVESLEHGIERTLPAYHTMHESDSSGLETDNKVYSCKNCFKRYVPTDKSEENIRDEDVGYVSLPLSALAEGGDVPPPTARGYLLGGTSESTNVLKDDKCKPKPLKKKPQPSSTRENESGLFLYIDLHGHASKKGIFMYGNYFEDVENSVECMLLPRIMALNNVHFHFSSCNFTERNMYLKDRRDGMSREGSGRVAVLKATGLVRSYTLECNYNTGRLVNVLPPTAREHAAGHLPHAATPAPPKYTPHIYEEVGHSLGASILDLTGEHPNSRVPCSEHRTLATMREWLRAHLRTTLHTMRTAQLMTSRLRPKTASPTRPPYARSKGKATDERKENTYAGAKSDSDRRTVAYPAALAPRPPHEPNSSARYGKRAEPAKAATRRPALPAPPPVPQPTVLTVDDSKPKSTVSKRRSVLAVRKPNASKSRLEALARPRHPPPPRPARAADSGDTPRPSLLTKVSKRSFSRPLRRDASSRHTLVAAVADDAIAGSAGWEDVGASSPAPLADAPLPTPVKRRSFPNPSPARLKKIRLKSGL